MIMFGKKEIKSGEELKQQQRIKTAQQWLPITDINGCIAYRRDGYIVGLLRVQPLNLELLSDFEKKRKIDALAEELNGETEELQIFCIGRPVDLNSYIDWLQDKAKMEQDFTRKRILKNFIQYASGVATSGEIIERRFYIIITKKAGNRAEQELMSRLQDLKTKLFSAELVAEVCNDDEIMDVFSLFANPSYASVEKATTDIYLSSQLDI